MVLAKEKYGLRGRAVGRCSDAPDGAHFLPFTAQTRMSGVDLDGLSIRKGAPDTMFALLQDNDSTFHSNCKALSKESPAMEGRHW